MVRAWLLTLPISALVGAVFYTFTQLFPGILGAIIIFALLLFITTIVFIKSHKNKIDAHNINADWDEKPTENNEIGGNDVPDAIEIRQQIDKPFTQKGVVPGA